MNLYDCKTNEQIGLPTMLTDFRGEDVYVLYVDTPAGGGSSGKIAVSKGGDDTATRLLYPGVVGCYIADEPRTACQ